ncbi:MAG: S-layer homology domain-containing protein, partial [Oscillospiraceae bacterium]|nr:S-layer homology domain-containing protein [Oscillospiraceae bacterium]
RGLMKGTSETGFSPEAPLTRAMLVTILYRLAGEPATNRSIPFADVDMGAYYGSAVSWAKQNGIVTGISETHFAPDANITREQFAVIIFRYAMAKGLNAVTMEENLHFKDAGEISAYAVSAMNWAVGADLIKGKSASTVNPKDNATRAEAAAILHRFLESGKA